MTTKKARPVRAVVRKMRKGGVSKKRAVSIGKKFATQRAKLRKRQKGK